MNKDYECYLNRRDLTDGRGVQSTWELREDGVTIAYGTWSEHETPEHGPYTIVFSDPMVKHVAALHDVVLAFLKLAALQSAD